MRENMYQGRLLGLNVLFGGPNLYYNKDLFAQALVPEPYDLWKRGEWTWDKFEEVSRLLTKRDEKGRTTQFGFLLPA